MRKLALASMSDLYMRILTEKSKYEPRPTGANVMETFEFLSGILHHVSCDAMHKTQLSLFDQTESEL